MTRIITEEIAGKLDAAIKAGGLSAETVDALKAKDVQLESVNLEQDAKLTETTNTLASTSQTLQATILELNDAKADLQAIADAIKNPATAPVETAETVAAILTESSAVEGTVEPAFPTE